MFTIEFDHFDWLSQFYSEWRQTSKISQFSRFLLMSRYTIFVKIWKFIHCETVKVSPNNQTLL